MPRFEPFAGLRYDPALVRLDQVIAPPYDVIESAERLRLATRSPRNSVLVELPEPDLPAHLDRYQVAARLLAAWRHDGVLRPDPTPSFYPYRMTSTEGRSSIGVIGALGLPLEGEPNDILPHEETLPKAKSDRLDLLRATRTNLSPIWGLSMTEGLSGLLDVSSPPVIDVADDEGVRHELWVVDDRAILDAVVTAVGASPVVIADGHHRYETARTYQREQREANGDRPGDYDLVMGLVTELSEDQLMVGAIHRAISGLPDRFDLVAALGQWFDIVRAGPLSDRVVAALGEAKALALVTADEAWLLNPRQEACEAADSDLDSSVVALALDSLPPHTNTHRHTWQEAIHTVTTGEAQAAILLRPVTVEQISEWATVRRRMPPKTTYFSPKPRTGLVFRTLG